MRDDTESDKRPRGRPREFDPDEVLDKVRVVFEEKGFAAASLDDLAAAAGLNRPSLYAAFGDKEQLYIHTLRRYGERISTRLDQILSEPGPIEARLAHTFASAVNLYCAPPRSPGCMIVGTAAVEARTHPEIAAAASAFLTSLEARLQQAFEAAADRGEIPSEPAPSTRARLTGAILDTLAVRARIGSSPESLKAFALSMVAAICR